MVLLTGARYSGVLDSANMLSGTCVAVGDPALAPDELRPSALLDRFPNLESLAFLDTFAGEIASTYDVVVVFEVGAGVVPLGADERLWRELVGRLGCLLAERASAVIRVCCGIPLALKGSLPWT